MIAIKDGERLASMETEVKNMGGKLNTMENSIQGLHGKFDAFSALVSTNYVPKSTFDEYKRTSDEKGRSAWLERIILIITTAAIGGLVGYFFNGGK